MGSLPDLGKRSAGAEKRKNVRHADTHASNARATATLGIVNGDATQAVQLHLLSCYQRTTSDMLGKRIGGDFALLSA